MYPFDCIECVRRIVARVLGSLCPMFHLATLVAYAVLQSLRLKTQPPQFAVFDNDHHSDLVLSSNSQP